MRVLRVFSILSVVCGIVAGSPVPAQPFVDGEVFAGLPGGKVARFHQGQASGSLRSYSGGQMTGMCFDAAGRLYATNFTGRKVALFDREGNLISDSWASGFGGSPESCVVDLEGNVYVGTVEEARAVYKFDATGSRLKVFRPRAGPRGLDWIDLAADQCTLFYTSEGPSVRRFDVCQDSQLEDFAQLSGICYALRIRENGEVMVACSDKVFRLSSQGQILQRYDIQQEKIFGLNLDRDGQTFWTGGLTSANVYRIDIDSGKGTAAPLFNAAGVHRQRQRKKQPESIFGVLGEILDEVGNAFLQGERMGGLAVFGEQRAALRVDPRQTPGQVVVDPEEPVGVSVESTARAGLEVSPDQSSLDADLPRSEPSDDAAPAPRLDGEPTKEPTPLSIAPPPNFRFDAVDDRSSLPSPPIASPPGPVPPMPESPQWPWHQPLGPLLAVAGVALLGGLVIYGFWAPSRFAPRAGLMLSQEADLGEGFFHAFRAQRSSGSSFFRDARLFLFEDFRFGKRAAGAWLRLRPSGKQVRLAPVGGGSVWRQQADGGWERLGVEDGILRPGVLHKNELGTIYFELRQK